MNSGDIAYLSKKVRVKLDEAGFEDCGIVASNSLDEYIIRDILGQGGQVDSLVLGNALVTPNQIRYLVVCISWLLWKRMGK